MTGPGKDDSYADKRDDYQKNEVAVDYNSGFTGAHSTSENNGHMITHTSFGVYVESSTADLDYTINRHNMHCYTNGICRHGNTASDGQTVVQLHVLGWLSLCMCCLQCMAARFLGCLHSCRACRS